MALVTKINVSNFFKANVTSCSHMINTAAKIKVKLTSIQLDMVRQTCFGIFLDVNLMWNDSVIYYVLLREVSVRWE